MKCGRMVWRAWVAVAFCAAVVSAQVPSGPPATPPSGSPFDSAPRVIPATQAAPIPEATLQQMYQRELGPKYNPADAARLYQAHQLLENYFKSSTAAERKPIIARIKALGLDPNVIGPLARIRMDWPALEGGVYYINEKVGPHDARYFLGLPKTYDRTRPWPLVIKLPAANAFLTNPPRTADEVVDIYTQWMHDELDHHPDAIVLMPLLNLTELYGPSYEGMNSVIEPMLHAAGRVNIDPARVYLIGHSMAAHAVWNLGLHYTTYFAAINPMAGGASADWQRLRLMNLRNVLPVVWADAGDTVVRPESSRAPVRILRNLKIDVDYLETRNIGHAPDAATVDRLYNTLRARTRELYPPVEWLQSNRPDTMFNRIDWLQLWQPVSTGKEHKVPFRHGSGRMILYDATFDAKADRKGNRFDVSTVNVDSFRIYLNDQMIDFSKTVTINVNQRPRFESIIKPDLDEMLRDQLFLGRGWRYFTAAVDIDVVPHPVFHPATHPTTGPVIHKGRIIVGPSDGE